jgi:hypothetical protein
MIQNRKGSSTAVMVISTEVRQEIERLYETHSLGDLSTKFGISKSSCSRIVKESKALDAQRKEESQAAADGGAEEKADSKPESKNDGFTYEPETAERTVLELDAEADQGVSKLLNAHVTEDPLSIETEDPLPTTDAPQDNESATAAPAAQKDAGAFEVSNDDMDALLKNLLPPDDKPAPTRGGRTKRAAAPAAPKRTLTTVPQQASPQPDPSKAAVPSAILITQIKLYVAHMGDKLTTIIGRTEADKDRFLKQLKPNMHRAELEATLSSIKGTLVIEQAVSGIESSIMVSAGLAQSLCPMVGMNLSSPCNIMTELDKQRDMIRMHATSLAISEFDWFESQCSPTTSLGLLCVNSIFACDAQNRAYNNQHQPQPETGSQDDEHVVPEEMQEKYRSM